MIWRIFFFNIQRPPPLDFQKRFLQCRGVIFQKKKFCVFGSLSNMSKNGLRMVVSQNFDMTHLSPPSTKMLRIFCRFQWGDLQKTLFPIFLVKMTIYELFFDMYVSYTWGLRLKIMFYDVFWCPGALVTFLKWFWTNFTSLIFSWFFLKKMAQWLNIWNNYISIDLPIGIHLKSCI